MKEEVKRNCLVCFHTYMKEEVPIKDMKRYCLTCGNEYKTHKEDPSLFCSLECSNNFNPTVKEKAVNQRFDEWEVQSYFNTGGVSCPFCGTNNIRPGSFEQHWNRITSIIAFPYSCNECEKRWQVVYRGIGLIMGHTDL